VRSAVNTVRSTSFLKPSRPWPVVLFAMGVIVRLVLIRVHPVVYGGDSVMRMMNADRMLIAYQLPFLQVLIFGANLLSQDPITVRYLMAVVGGLAGVAFCWLSSLLWGREVGLLGTLFFIFNPFILVHSLVPYQEILMLLLLCFGLALLFESDRWRNLMLASLFLGLACLTRYEAWIVTAAAAGFYWKQGRAKRAALFTWKSSLLTLVLFGWAPVLWIVCYQGVSPSGTFVLEGFREWERLYRIPYILMMTIHHAGVPAALLAAVGCLELWRTSRWKDPRVQMLALATAAFFVALVFSAHGVPPNPIRYVTDRESHWPLLAMLWATGLGAYRLRNWLAIGVQRPEPARVAAAPLRGAVYCGVLGACLFWGLYQTHGRMVGLTSTPELQLNYAVAQYLNEHLPDGQNTLILAEPAPAAAILDYLEKARQKSGPEGREAARKVVEAMNIGPFDYSRTAVNSRFGKTRFFHPGQLEKFGSQNPMQTLRSLRIRLVVRFANYVPSSPWESQLLDFVRWRCKRSADITGPVQMASIFEIPD
jgi:hypothetical protein